MPKDTECSFYTTKRQNIPIEYPAFLGKRQKMIYQLRQRRI